ncbi:MAG TPA: TlpA disulfide reductase family protein [Candidatus Acidoferrales bacterium]|nr:TlpA disulfide reductase family protein [Candidatus Acidoferrales bacterium]
MTSNAPVTPRAARLPAALLAAALLVATGARAAALDGVGAPAPRALESLRHHVLHRLDGGALSLADLKGEVVVVNFWATWCAPCRRELPRLDALNAELASHGGRVLAVSIDDDAQNVERFAQRHALHLAVMQDGADGLAHELDLQAVPVTLVLSRDGEIAYSSRGSDDAALDRLTAVVHQLEAGHPLAAGVAAEDRP